MGVQQVKTEWLPLRSARVRVGCGHWFRPRCQVSTQDSRFSARPRADITAHQPHRWFRGVTEQPRPKNARTLLEQGRKWHPFLKVRGSTPCGRGRAREPNPLTTRWGLPAPTTYAQSQKNQTRSGMGSSPAHGKGGSFYSLEDSQAPNRGWPRAPRCHPLAASSRLGYQPVAVPAPSCASEAFRIQAGPRSVPGAEGWKWGGPR